MIMMMIDNIDSDNLDIKVNRIIKKLRKNWIDFESKNYENQYQKQSYRKYMNHYCGVNPYNVLEEKYQKRIFEDLGW